jgi:DNA-binding NarL/FixJ family response regulator
MDASHPEKEFGQQGYFPVSAEKKEHFKTLRKRISLAFASTHANTALILVFRSRMMLGLLAEQFTQIEVIGACTGESEALTLMERRPAGLLMMGDDLANGSVASLMQRALALQPNIRTMVVAQKEKTVMEIQTCNAIIMDEDLGLRPDYPVLQGLLAMLTNTHYQSPAVAKSPDDPESPLAERSKERQTRLTAREQDILNCYSRGLTNKETAIELNLSPHTVKTYSSDLLAKLGVSNRQKALRKALALGMERILS